jgi:hypothetical protein
VGFGLALGWKLIHCCIALDGANWKLCFADISRLCPFVERYGFSETEIEVAFLSLKANLLRQLAVRVVNGFLDVRYPLRTRFLDGYSISESDVEAEVYKTTSCKFVSD